MSKDQTANRIQLSMLAEPERRVLSAIVVRLPLWVTPDILTAFGILGAVIVLIGGLTSNLSVHFLWLSNIGLVVHWLGDSLDGGLARWRGIERPRYGFALDQNMDLFGNLLIALGVGATPFCRLDLTLLALAAYHFLAVHALISSVIKQEFRLDVYGFGPTEMRLGIFSLNILIILFGARRYNIGYMNLSWCDGVVLLAFLVMLGLFAIALQQQLASLAEEEPARAVQVAPESGPQ